MKKKIFKEIKTPKNNNIILGQKHNKEKTEEMEYEDDFNSEKKSNFKSNIYSKKVESITKSNEPGFTGDPSKWFNDENFYENLPGKSDIYHKKDYYFNSYSNFNIHEEMLKDKVRTGAYQKAILENKEIFKDKIVLDIGSGTGILSFFAAEAGAKHVYGIEFADIADFSIEIIKKNNMQDKITIIKAKVEEAELPVDKVDIILSEWMGYFLLYESMLDCVLYARDKWLKKDGYMFPDRAQMFLAGIEDKKYKHRKINSWNNIYGFNMKCIKEAAIAEPLIDNCTDEYLISSTCKIYDIDLYNIKKEELDFMSGYQIEFNCDDIFNGLVSWFNVSFNKVQNKVLLPTGPYDKPTHWKQVVFYIEDDVYVKKGTKLKGNIAVIKDKKNFRFINVKISYHFENNSKVIVQQYKLT
jgi:protein arginine N-methyltransferase 1